MTDWYTASGNPTQGSAGASNVLRSEYNSIAAAFSKMPALTGYGGLLVGVNSSGTALQTYSYTEVLSALNAAKLGTNVTFLTINGTTITASTQFSGPGTGLTGTAAGLSIGGNAATATNSANATNATNATSATTATNLASGSAGTLPYQSASGTTAMLAAGASGNVLLSGGAGAPSWATTTGTGSVVKADSPAFTGTPTAPTAGTGTNTTQVATTAFVTTNKQTAKAWVNFNGTSATPITPRANYNISSVTKNGTGDYTLNFTNALSDANYTVAFNNKADSSSFKTMYEMGTGTPIRTVNAFRMIIINQAQAVADSDQVNVAFFGN